MTYDDFIRFGVDYFCCLSDISGAIVQIDTSVFGYRNDTVAIGTVFNTPHLIDVIVECVHTFSFS